MPANPESLVSLHTRTAARLGAVAACIACAAFAVGQTPVDSTAGSGYTEQTATQLRARAEQMTAQARKSTSGVASVTLDTYPGHSTMLTVRTASGGAEAHQHFSDLFVVLEGEGTEVVGGTIEGAHVVSPGETRGLRVAGGESHPLHKGDIIHISPGVPHQLLVAPGSTFTYFVVKVEQK